MSGPCVYCGTILVPKKTRGRWPKRFCGPGCKRNYWRLQGRRAFRAVKRYCKVCGGLIPVKETGAQRYVMCSAACSAEDNRRRHGCFTGPKKPPHGRNMELRKAYGKKYHPEWRRKNRDRLNARRRERAATDPSLRETQKIYRRRYLEKHPGAGSEATRRWRAAHPEYKPPYESRSKYERAYHEKNRARIAEKNKRWKAANRAKARAQRTRRHARMKGAAGWFTEKNFAARSAMFGDKCWIPRCGKPGVEIDHVIAVSRGGSNWPANLRPICRRHNMMKNAKPWRVFLASL